MVISTWNEWAENTQVEAGQRFGELYVWRTRFWTAALKTAPRRSTGPLPGKAPGRPLYHLGVSDGSPVSTEAVMEEIRGRIRDDLHARLVGHGARDDFAERAIFDEVDRVFAQAMAHEDPRALLLPARLEEPWRPLLSLEFPGHRGRLAAGADPLRQERGCVLPVVRWLFEYSAGELPPPAPPERRADGDRADARRRSRPSQGAPRRARAPARRMKLLSSSSATGPRSPAGRRRCAAPSPSGWRRGTTCQVATSCATDYVTWANVLAAGHVAATARSPCIASRARASGRCRSSGASAIALFDESGERRGAGSSGSR